MDREEKERVMMEQSIEGRELRDRLLNRLEEKQILDMTMSLARMRNCKLEAWNLSKGCLYRASQVLKCFGYHGSIANNLSILDEGEITKISNTLHINSAGLRKLALNSKIPAVHVYTKQLGWYS